MDILIGGIVLSCALASVFIVLIYRDLMRKLGFRDDRIRELSGRLLEAEHAVKSIEGKVKKTAEMILKISISHNALVEAYGEHGHGLLDDETAQPMPHSTTPVNLVDVLGDLVRSGAVVDDEAGLPD